MKRITITYLMDSRDEVAETYITLPVEDKIAVDVLERGTQSEYVRPYGIVWMALNALANLQGYKFSQFMCAREVTV